METQELHRGRLIDHIQLVVRDIEASRRFYKAVFAVLGIPVGGDEEGLFLGRRAFRLHRRQPGGARQADWTPPSPPSRRTDRPRWSTLSTHARPRAAAASTTASRASGPITPATTPPSCSTPTATTLEAVFHGEANRSAPSVKITFSTSVTPCVQLLAYFLDQPLALQRRDSAGSRKMPSSWSISCCGRWLEGRRPPRNIPCRRDPGTS